MELFEIVAFENHDLYDGDFANTSNVIETFLKFYKRFFMSYDEIPQESILFNRGRFYISYTDNWSGDKPIKLMLLGNLDENLINEIQSDIKKLYEKRND